MEQKKFEDLQIQDNYMFYAVMSDLQYCKPFLERVLGKKISYIKYSNMQEIRDLPVDDKMIRLNVQVEGEDEVYCVVMRTEKEKDGLRVRMRYDDSMAWSRFFAAGHYSEYQHIIFISVCPFDYYEAGRYNYTVMSQSDEVPELWVYQHIVLNTKGTVDDISPELKTLLNYIDGKQPEDDYTRDLEEAVQTVRNNEEWRTDYMTLQMHYQEKYEEGMETEKRQTVLRMLKAGKLSPEDIAKYSDLTLEQVLDIQKEL